MTEEQHRRWDIAIKVLGFAALIVSGAVGLHQYKETKEKEFYSQFWNERLRLYVKTLDAAARISAAITKKESDQAKAEFRTLFDGSMSVVQDPTVDRAMHEFAARVRQVEGDKMKRQDLGIHSYNLGRTCFDSIKNSWNKPFSYRDDTDKNAKPLRSP